MLPEPRLQSGAGAGRAGRKCVRSCAVNTVKAHGCPRGGDFRKRRTQRAGLGGHRGVT